MTGLLALLASGCADDSAGNASRAGRGGTPTVVATAANEQSIIDEIQALGTVRANESVDIRPRIASVVETVLFEEGENVAAGKLLVELENSEIVAELAVARAALAESRNLYERSRSLASSQAISASNLDQLLAQVNVGEAQVEAAQARLAKTRINAPFAGVVGLRRVSPGSFVDTQSVVTTLDEISTVKLDFSVPEVFLSVVGNEMPIIAHSLVYPEREFSGAVASIDTRLDPVSRSVQVRALLPNPDGALRPGMFMTVNLQRDRGTAIVIPEQSVVPEGSRQFVFVIVDGTIEQREIALGKRMPGRVVVDRGLEPGEQVVTEGTQKVRPGMAVKVLTAAAQGGNAPPSGE